MYCQTKKADYSKIICLDAIETVEYTWHLEETFLTVQNGLKLNLVTAYLLTAAIHHSIRCLCQIPC